MVKNKISLLSTLVLTLCLSQANGMHRGLYKKQTYEIQAPKKKNDKKRNLRDITRIINITSATLGDEICRCTKDFIRFNYEYLGEPNNAITKLVKDIIELIEYDEEYYFFSHSIFDHSKQKSHLREIRQWRLNYELVSPSSNEIDRKKIASDFKESFNTFVACMKFYLATLKSLHNKKKHLLHYNLLKNINASLLTISNHYKKNKYLAQL